MTRPEADPLGSWISVGILGQQAVGGQVVLGRKCGDGSDEEDEEEPGTTDDSLDKLVHDDSGGSLADEVPTSCYSIFWVKSQTKIAKASDIPRFH